VASAAEKAEARPQGAYGRKQGWGNGKCVTALSGQLAKRTGGKRDDLVSTIIDLVSIHDPVMRVIVTMIVAIDGQELPDFRKDELLRSLLQITLSELEGGEDATVRTQSPVEHPSSGSAAEPERQ
jgi:hypothetical protein